MQKLFLDANIVLSFHFHDAEKRQQKAIDLIFSKLEKKEWEGYISLVTFYQLLYFIDKKIQNPKTAAKRAYSYLNILHLTPFYPQELINLDYSKWPDYEDGLQYTCALSENCDYIITSNYFDYFASKIPVFDPITFVLKNI